MKRFLKNICILALIVIPLLYALDYAVTKGLRRSRQEEFAVWNDIYNSKINADVLIMGSSKARMMVSPFALHGALNLSCYNIGMDSWQFSMQYARFRVYLQHNRKPSYIIQVIDIPFFSDRADLYDAVQFIPYLHDTIISNITDRYTGRFTTAEKYIPFFKYNQHLSVIREGLTRYFYPFQLYKGNPLGYHPYDLNWDSTFDHFKHDNPNGIRIGITKRVLDEYDTYLKYCKANNIKVIMLYTPVYYEEPAYINNAAEIKDLFTTLSRKYDMPIIDNSNDTLSLHKKYFFNSQHMNETGTNIYSRTLADEVKKLVIAPRPAPNDKAGVIQ